MIAGSPTHQVTAYRSDTASGPEPISVLAVASHRPDEITKPLAAMRIRTETLEIDPSTGRLRRAVDSYRQISRGIRETDPDLILLDCYEITGIVVAFLARQHNIPLVVRVVGDTWRGYESTTLRPVRSLSQVLRFLEHRASYRLNEFVFDQAAGFVVVSEELRDIVHRRTGCPRERIGVVPVPLTFDPRETSGSEQLRRSLGIEQGRVLLTVTNLNFRGKFDGLETILSELVPLLAEDPELAYIVAGDGKYYGNFLSAIDETIDDPTVRDRIYAPGYVDDVADLYKLADVFVYVSYRDGYPNAVLEAQTAGLPVVANAAHGMLDQITAGESGYLVDPTVPGELRERLSYLLDHPAERERIGDFARIRALSENTPEIVGKQLERFLHTFVDDDRDYP